MNDEGKKFHFDTRYWDIPQRYGTISLYQVGDLSCKGGFEVGAHLQPCYEISYIMSGEGVFIVNDTSYPVKKGDVFLCLPDQTHNLIADKDDPFRYCYLAFFFNESDNTSNPFDQVEQLLLNIKSPCITDKQHIDVPFNAMLSELNSPKILLQQMVETYCMQIIVSCYRNYHKNMLSTDTLSSESDTLPAGLSTGKAADNYANELVYAVISYIDNNLFEITALTQIATDLNYSYSHLGRIFASELGVSLHTYYNKKRIEAAKTLLDKGVLSVSDIAIKLQYQSVHSFSKAFKKAENISPKQYQLATKKSTN